MSKSILIVEDEETLRHSLKRIFKKDGFDVDTAESAEKGLSLLEKNIYDDNFIGIRPENLSLSKDSNHCITGTLSKNTFMPSLSKYLGIIFMTRVIW